MHLIYDKYRGEEDDQQVVNLKTGDHTWWAMTFMDAGIKYRNRWYRLDGTTEADEQPTERGGDGR